MERDHELLSRIIPQIYSEEMHYMVLGIYEFPSMIYTLYATESNEQEILTFVANIDNIKVVTVPVADSRLELLIPGLHENGKLVYVHTIQHYEDLIYLASSGVNGFYTGLLLPKDYELYSSAA